MKKWNVRITWIVCLMLTWGFVACEKFDANKLKEGYIGDYTNPDVDKWVACLKSGESYWLAGAGDVKREDVLPLFTSEHIEALLAYAEDTTHVGKFPGNPVSSIFPAALRQGGYYVLNECILCTVECIRTGKLAEGQLPLQFPGALLPRSIGNEDGTYRLSGTELTDIGQQYKAWWKKHGQSNWREVDPLEGTKYEWTWH